MTRAKNNFDRRQVLIKITPNGKDIINKKPSLLQKEFLLEFSQLQKWEQHLLLSSVERIASMMKAKTYLANSMVAHKKGIHFKKKNTDL